MIKEKFGDAIQELTALKLVKESKSPEKKIGIDGCGQILFDGCYENMKSRLGTDGRGKDITFSPENLSTTASVHSIITALALMAG